MKIRCPSVGNMAKLGPDERVEYKKVPVVEGYDLWAGTYDTDPNNCC